jgi:putative SOS response-associated peptidase YedK
MCARYHSVLDAARLKQFFKINGLKDILAAKDEVFPGYAAPLIRRPPERDSDDDAVPDRDVVMGLFGLLPHWAKDMKLAKSTYNARSETVAVKPAFRDAWSGSQHCIIPAEAMWEPDWRSGRCVWTRIGRADGQPIGIAGLWSWWRPLGGDQDVHSFTMLTINADTHPVMSQYHRPGEEKRMVVVLAEEDYDGWLDAPADRSMEFMRQCAPTELTSLDSSSAERERLFGKLSQGQ